MKFPTFEKKSGLATGQIYVVETNDDEKRHSLLECHLLRVEKSVIILKAGIAIHPIHHAFSFKGRKRGGGVRGVARGGGAGRGSGG